MYEELSQEKARRKVRATACPMSRLSGVKLSVVTESLDPQFPL
jgi:hypothetical protein